MLTASGQVTDIRAEQAYRMAISYGKANNSSPAAGLLALRPTPKAFCVSATKLLKRKEPVFFLLFATGWGWTVGHLGKRNPVEHTIESDLYWHNGKSLIAEKTPHLLARRLRMTKWYQCKLCDEIEAADNDEPVSASGPHRLRTHLRTHHKD